MKIKTDSKSVNDPKDPKECHVFSLYQCFATKEEKNDLNKLYLKGAIGYGDAKQLCFEKLNSVLKEPREIYNEIINDRIKLRGILEAGRDKARIIAIKVNERIRNKVGI